MQFADIILPLHLPRPLTYGIPVKWQGKIVPGMRVEVNMGKNKIYAGIVLRIHDHRPDSYKVKPIRNLIDAEPIVTPVQLDFWQWIARYYLCSIGDVMNAALPAHLKLMSESLLNWNAAMEQPPLDLSDTAYLIAEALQIKRQLTISEIRQLSEGKNMSKAIHELLDRGMATISELLEERYQPRMEKYIRLHEEQKNDPHLQKTFNELEKAPRQLALLMTYFQLSPEKKFVTVRELVKKSGCTHAQVKMLIDKNIFECRQLAVDRLPPDEDTTAADLQLTDAQQTALLALQQGWKQQNVALLHGVTGSGKTLIYVALIRQALKKNQQTLLLLPEIALTTHIVSRLRAYFSDELGVYHSRFTNNERVEIWEKVKRKQYKVILGARSALWLPFQDLGYIIVDEEHDSSFKQYNPSPRFHARDAAIYLAGLHAAKVLLGSATPSLETAFNAKNGKYHYVPLTGRYLGVALPEINIVPARNKQAGLSSLLTVNLLEAIQNSLREGKQVILFQNKRGYTPFLICSACGWVATCKFCDVSLTYHKVTDKLHCHYCGHTSIPIKHCGKCGQPAITARSFGTERVEEELQRIFPKMRTARMDWDSMKGKNKYLQLMDNFSRGRIDLLVGTQMVVKGLDFQNVGLVGILSADSLLSYPDFRVNERGFQLMEQVSGRAGRVDGKGKVFIQAYNVTHPVLTWVTDHDYKAFYQAEILERKQFGYPPFSRMIKLTCKHPREDKVAEAARILSTKIATIPEIRMQGPAPALIPRIRNHYLQEIWIKIPPKASLIAKVKEQIISAINHTLAQRGYSSVQIVPDVDPV